MSKGIDVRATTSELLSRVMLQDSAGAIVTTGTTSLYLYELQMSDGTLKSYDFNDNTFKTTALTTETASMTHRTGNNAGTNTGIWTHRLATLTGFTAGNIYLARVKNTNASPTDQVREFQFGSAQGDLTVTAAQLDVNTKSVSGTAQTAGDLYGFLVIRSNTCQAGSSLTQIVLDAGASAVNDVYAGDFLDVKVGSAEWQRAAILSYNGGTKTATVAGLNATIGAPANTDPFRIVLFPSQATIDDFWGATTRTLTAASNLTSNAQPVQVDASGYPVIAPAGLDQILVESGISASTSFVNDSGTQLTSVNPRQILAVLASAVAAVFAGADGASPSSRPLGKSAAANRLSWTTDATGRTAVVVRVPD